MKKIISLIQKQGPMTGRELLSYFGPDVLSLWRTCSNTGIFSIIIFGRRFIRFDKRIGGCARLSPSIMREFLTYTVIGLKKQDRDIQAKATFLQNNIAEISKYKFELAKKTMISVVASHTYSKIIQKNACFVIGGDVSYGMAHAEGRPEPSTGKLIKGSDLDIIVIYDGLKPREVKELDQLIYLEKFRLIRNPELREEIDYIIKDIGKAEKQLSFDNFKSMIASKILHESKFLCGSRIIYNRLKKMILSSGIPKRLKTLEIKALADRNDAETCLLKNREYDSEEIASKLFYTTEEREEIF